MNRLNFFRKVCILISLLEGVASAGSVQQTLPKYRFAFWYEGWKDEETLAKLRPANVIIGVGPQFIPAIHRAGGKVLQYVTYYQSRFHTSFLNDQEDLPNVGFFATGKYLPSAFGGPDNYVLCSNSTELRRRISVHLESSLKQGYDGLFVDNAYIPPATKLICQASHGHVAPGATGNQAYLDLLNGVRNQLKKRRPDAILMVNPGSPADADALESKGRSLWDLSDYIPWESFGYSSNRTAGHDTWQTTLREAVRYSHDKSKVSKIVALSYPVNNNEALYSYVIARIFGFSWTANLGEKDANSEREGGHFGNYFGQIPWNLGEPTGKPPEDISTIPLRRCFERGEAYANIGPHEIVIRAPGAGLLQVASEHKNIAGSAKFVLPPHAAAVVLLSKPGECHF